MDRKKKKKGKKKKIGQIKRKIEKFVRKKNVKKGCSCRMWVEQMKWYGNPLANDLIPGYDFQCQLQELDSSPSEPNDFCGEKVRRGGRGGMSRDGTRIWDGVFHQTITLTQ
ncbi:hypothetical protein CDAR_259601 [Caerostris darwini]|uniref:Uncharacterized protein n=1 Tax=Caerostris darwini TaxID=1538125 RepID=A0AAV4VMV3_9ARAC|nr:hypothetical protein CDAR_259601 [Caerostris darwini]